MEISNLTEGEVAVLKGILFNEYNDPFIGDESGELNTVAVWSWSIYECSSASKVCKSRRSMSGLISSLVKKGLVGIDPANWPEKERCTWLTDKGVKLVTPHFSKWEEEDEEERLRERKKNGR